MAVLVIQIQADEIPIGIYYSNQIHFTQHFGMAGCGQFAYGASLEAFWYSGAYLNSLPEI